MSGHSKWATIHRQKEVKDARKGQAFTKMANAITIAVKSGGGIGDMDKNFRLRLAVEKARSINTPNENIQRAIKRGMGTEGNNVWEEITYEGFGPGGIVVIVETATDNKNRTGSLIRNLFEKGGGSMGGPGSASFQFERLAKLVIEKKDDFENQELELIDLGVIDIVDKGESIEAYFKPEMLNEIKKSLEEKGWLILEAGLGFKATTTIKISDLPLAQKVIRFMDSFEQQDDVQQIFSNFEIDASIVDKM